MSTPNKNIVRALFEDVWNRGDLSRLGAIMHADCIIRTAADTPLLEGIDQYREFVAAHLALRGEVHISVEEQIAEGDRIATRWTSLHKARDAKDSQSLMGMSIHHLRAGKIYECWDTWDTLRAGGPEQDGDVLDKLSIVSG